MDQNPNPSSMPPAPTVAPPPPQQGASNNSGMAILAYLGILILVPFFTEAKNDPFVKFHLKQGLSLIITEAVALIIVVIPILGWIISPILWIASLVFIIIGVVNAAS